MADVVVRVTSDLRVIASPDAPPLTGSEAMTLGKRLLEKGVIQLAREVARDGRPARRRVGQVEA